MTQSKRPDRREFLKQTFGAGLAAGMGPLLAGCGGGDDLLPENTLKREARTYFFDLSNADAGTDFFLVAGSRHHPLVPATRGQIANARTSGNGLLGVGDSSITHVGESLDLPARLQMCYVKGVSRTGKHKTGEWDMHTMFYHVPTVAGTLAASKKAASCGKPVTSLRADFAACPKTLKATALRAAQPAVSALASSNSVCVGADYDQYKDYFDHAMALICHHPEIGSFDAPTLAYVQQYIVCADLNLLTLAQSLYKQGAASVTPGGWATLVPYVDPATGQQQHASNGDLQYVTQHSATTLQFVGLAIRSILPKVKNDLLLGTNITGLDKTVVNTKLLGKIWVTQNGVTAGLVSPPASVNAFKLTAVGDATQAATSWTARDVSTGNGFRVANVSGNGTRLVSFEVQNWYLRYLGLYIRYLDGAGNPIAMSALPKPIQQQFTDTLSGTYDCFLDMINQELVILGIPCKQDLQTFNISVPDSAASIQIIAGGLGRGRKTYPDTIAAAAVMTVVLDIAIPGLFLTMAAVSGYSSLSAKLATSTKLLTDTAKIFILAVADYMVDGAYSDPSVFLNLVMPIAFTLVKSAAAMYAIVQENLAEGEAEGIAEDCIPFGIGLLLQAALAAAVGAEIAETSGEIGNSPWNYVTQVDATHNLTVTVNHDPLDTAGFPAVATSYTLLAVCDGASPVMAGPFNMPGTTQTAPLTYTFNGLPSGGTVTVTASFYSNDDWLAGAGTTGPIDNTLDSASITIKEILVPLTSSTVYGHKQILSGFGNSLQWVASAVGPTATTLNCNNTAGSLCALQSIAVSETFGNVGFVWKSYSAGITPFGGGGAGQLYQFANVSITHDPQSSWMYSGQGFTSPPRMAYRLSSPVSQSFYIDTSQSDAGIVRRINMTAVGVPPTFDSPSSGLAVGRFNNSSDAFLIHPTGKLISINTELGKMEVLTPSATPVDDASAPLAQAFSGPGTRDGLLNGPACAVVSADGTILVLEQTGNQIQAFDTGANPVPYFAGGSATMALLPRAGTTYLDVAIEFKGFIYVLSVVTGSTYNLDIYKPTGEWLATTQGMNASKLTIDLFRNVYTLNFLSTQMSPGITMPTVSEWIPSTP